MSREFDLARMLVLPGRKLAGLRFVMKNASEVLPVVIRVAAKRCAIPIYFTSSPSLVAEEFPVLAFLDMTWAGVGIAKLAKELEATGMVRHAEVIEPVAEGLIVDNISFPLTVGGERAIILRTAAYRRLIDEVKFRFGSAADAFFYYMGLELGKGLAKVHRSTAETVGLKDPVEILRSVNATMFQWAGFGRLEVIHLGDSGGKIAVYNSFECEGAKVTGEPYAALVKGMIAGAFEGLLEKPFDVAETECVAKGDRRCVFEVRAK